jgi:hypothetical protein
MARVPLPSPRGTNAEGLFMRPFGMAHDAAPDGTKATDRCRAGARDEDEIDKARADLADNLESPIGDP